MNTSKQVNVMIGLLFLAFLAFGAYILNEPNRQADAEEAQSDLLAHRGADLFVNNCRTCHGLEGEGAVAPALNRDAFLILGEDNEFGAPETPEGDARAVRNFLFNTIACGRTNTIMPLWSDRYGGPLSDTQINYIVDMITMGAWDKVEELGREHDEEAGEDPSEVVFSPEQAASSSVTQANCGQYTGQARQDILARDPFGTGGDNGDGTAEPTATPSQQPEAQTMVKGMLVGEFFTANCAACHGEQRQGLIGPALTPDSLTQADDVYFDAIANGRPGTAMPSWRASADLTDEEIDNLVQFLKNVAP